MTPRLGRDQGLATVRKATIWVAGAAVVGVGAFAALFGRPTDVGASTGDQPTDGSVAASHSAAGSSSASPTTTARSSGRSTSATATPTTQAPRTSHRRARVSSGGS